MAARAGRACAAACRRRTATGLALQDFPRLLPFYLTEHANRTSRRLHVVGTGLAVGLVTAEALTARPWLFLGAAVAGYAVAWLGRLAFERNRPVTFRYPLFSLLGDFRLLFETITGRRPW